MFDRTGSKWSFSGDIHRVATFTHVSSLTVVAGILSCPLHGSQRFLCLLLISSKVATNLGTNMYAHIVYSYSHLTFWIPGWLWQPLTLWPTALFDIGAQFELFVASLVLCWCLWWCFHLSDYTCLAQAASSSPLICSQMEEFSLPRSQPLSSIELLENTKTGWHWLDIWMIYMHRGSAHQF